jgi:hypothetical protein
MGGFAFSYYVHTSILLMKRCSSEACIVRDVSQYNKRQVGGLFYCMTAYTEPFTRTDNGEDPISKY